MKKYTKPVVEIVSLKSSEHIAKTTFSDIKGKFIEDALYNGNNGKSYAVSQYTITSSTKVDA